MDGLVLDSEAGYFAAWQQAAAEMGYGLSREFCLSLSGSHGSAISQRLLTHCGTEFDLDNFYQLSNRLWRERVRQQGIPVKAGFFRLLQLIRQLQLPFCLATNSRRSDAEQCLAWAGLDAVFPKLISREDVPNPKPAADIFIKASAELGMHHSDCLVLEDSPIGIEAATAAACPCIFVPSVQPPDARASMQADLVLPDLAEVADFISAAFDHPL
ncbi:phosphoglycolate phosphatase [Methylococcales bacterium]|nr:phosphoglycolate phosphatase [Methylococcales bacterium]